MKYRHKAALCTLAIVLFLAGGVWCHSKVIVDRSKHLNALKEETDRLKAQLADTLAEEDIMLLRAALLASEAAVPNRQQRASLMKDVIDGLDATGVGDRSVNMGTIRTHDTMHQIPLSLSFEGNLADVYEFLQRIHGYDRILRVERLVLARDAHRSSNIVGVSLRLSAFAHNPGDNP